MKLMFPLFDWRWLATVLSIFTLKANAYAYATVSTIIANVFPCNFTILNKTSNDRWFKLDTIVPTYLTNIICLSVSAIQDFDRDILKAFGCYLSILAFSLFLFIVVFFIYLGKIMLMLIVVCPVIWF